MNFKEEEVAKTLGVTRGEIKKLRAAHLQEGADWEVQGRDVVLTDDGLTRLQDAIARLKVKAAEKEQATQNELHAMYEEQSAQHVSKIMPEVLQGILQKVQENRKAEKMKVLKTFRNPRIMECATEEGKVVRVRVRSSENFLPGMELQAFHEQDDVYTFEGRCPRWRGKW